MAERPTGTVTFLFTDLEGSTRLWERHPGPMREALALHDRVLQDALGAHGGYVFSHGGDGFGVAFTRSDAALAAATAIQRQLAVTPWPAPVELRVRIGVHTGEAEERDGNYFGPALNRCARLMAAATGGTVLVSGATRELGLQRLPPDLALRDLGERRLRDIDRSEHVYQLVGPGLPEPRPSPSSPRPGPSRLPVSIASFVGRESDITALSVLVHEHRLVTLIGPAGVGKTRLAVELAAEVAEAFGAAWFVDLAPARTDGDALVALARALDLPNVTDRTSRGAVVELLGNRPALLVLDNCEHLLDDAGTLAQLVFESCPEVHILATSRSRLRLAGERVWRVPPLPGGSDGAGVRLFCDRASAVSGTFDATGDHAVVIERILERLGGLPLAVELVAAQAATMTVYEIDAELGAPVEPGQQVLADALARSYRLLVPQHRELFERLSVFAGRFDAEAAAAVGRPATPAETIVGLRELAEQSLVAVDLSGRIARYHLLQPIQAWAAVSLTSRGADQAVHELHARYFCELAQRGDQGRAGPDEAVWVDRLEADLDNFRAAVRWADGAGEVAIALATYVALYELAAFQGHREIFEWIDPRRDRYATSGAPFAPAALAMRALQHDTARPASAELVERASELQLLRGGQEHRLLPWSQGFVRASFGDAEGAADWYERAAEVILRTEGENGRYATALAISCPRTDAERAQTIVDLAARAGQPTGRAAALSAQARVVRNTDPAAAIALLADASAHAAAVRNRRQLAYNDLSMAAVLAQVQDQPRALATLRAALEHADHVGQHEVVWSVVTRLHDLLQAADQPGRAERLLRAWLRTFPQVAARYRSARIDPSSPPAPVGQVADTYEELVEFTLDVIDDVLAELVPSGPLAPDLAVEQREVGEAS